MRSIRDQFIPFFSRFLAPHQPVELPFSLQNLVEGTPHVPEKKSSLYEWMRAPEHRNVVQSVLWVVLVCTTALLSVVAFVISNLLNLNREVPACTIAVLWGLLFGTAVLFFLPSKTVITVWGCLLGTSLDKAVTGTGILESASKAIASSAVILAANTSLEKQMIQLVLWVFLATFGTVCLPAFFRN